MKIKKLNIIFILVIIAVVGLMTHTAIRYNNAEKKEAQYKKEKVWKQNFYEKMGARAYAGRFISD